METLAKIMESGLIIQLRPAHNRPILPSLAALCSGGVCAAEFPIENPLSLESIQSGSRLFPDLILGVGNIQHPSDGKRSIAAGARFLTSPGYSREIAALCKEQEVLYLPQCMTPSELLAVEQDGLPAVSLFSPHLWGSTELVSALIAAFPHLTVIAANIPADAVLSMCSQTKIAACSVTLLENLPPEALADQCRSILNALTPSDW